MHGKLPNIYNKTLNMKYNQQLECTKLYMMKKHINKNTDIIQVQWQNYN